MMAYPIGDLHVLAPGLVLLEYVVVMRGFRNVYADLILALDPPAVDGRVHHPGIGVVAGQKTRSDVGPGVHLMMHLRRESGGVHASSRLHDFLHGSLAAGDHYRLDPLLEPLAECRTNLVYARIHQPRQPLPARHQESNQGIGRPASLSHHVMKYQDGKALLPFQLGNQGRHLIAGAYLLLDMDYLLREGLFMLAEEQVQVFQKWPPNTYPASPGHTPRTGYQPPCPYPLSAAGNP